MDPGAFRTPTGLDVTGVTAEEMRDVDRVAVEEYGLSLLQMMEQAGRGLAREALDLVQEQPVVVLAGGGGNGGGGLACARHLANREIPVTVVLDRQPAELEGVVASQYHLLDRMEESIRTDVSAVDTPGLVVDALVGYGLEGPLRGSPRELVRWAEDAATTVLSLDVPSGIDATTGEEPGDAIHPARTFTLALPKTGLRETPSELILGDISVPVAVYETIGIPYTPPFGHEFSVSLDATKSPPGTRR
ncbi:NAD(P)H-hydrate epimerase [Halosolutus halophilus]|uniref:NAD(P)H-hydrate epimerase n=1 Tax=Halosolutus halophilus TaxID=1552990 RepID=UPI002234F352|nr:NAD(P)H-hydrate epimerase [Halosolutus halophilus]